MTFEGWVDADEWEDEGDPAVAHEVMQAVLGRLVVTSVPPKYDRGDIRLEHSYHGLRLLLGAPRATGRKHFCERGGRAQVTISARAGRDLHFRVIPANPSSPTQTMARSNMEREHVAPRLPVELWEMVCEHLQQPDLAQLRGVNRFFLAFTRPLFCQLPLIVLMSPPARTKRTVASALPYL